MLKAVHPLELRIVQRHIAYGAMRYGIGAFGQTRRIVRSHRRLEARRRPIDQRYDLALRVNPLIVVIMQLR